MSAAAPPRLSWSVQRPPVPPQDAAASHSNTTRCHDAQAPPRLRSQTVPGFNSFFFRCLSRHVPEEPWCAVSVQLGCWITMCRLGENTHLGFVVQQRRRTRSSWMSLMIISTEHLVIAPPTHTLTHTFSLGVEKPPPACRRNDFSFYLCSTLAVSCDQPFQSSLVVMPTEHLRRVQWRDEMFVLHRQEGKVRVETWFYPSISILVL